ncbi:MAG: leucine-rich repeat domain-containing protein [Candidatus Avilachnospira sp.]|jgi:hypothetical protein
MKRKKVSYNSPVGMRQGQLILCALVSSFFICGNISGTTTAYGEERVSTPSEAYSVSEGEYSFREASGYSYEKSTGELLILNEEGLKEIDEGNTGIDFLTVKKIAFGDEIKALDKPMFAGLPGLSELDLNKVSSIAGFSFTLCENLEKINGPELSYIGKHAFSNNNALKEASFPKLKEVSDSAFYNCTALEKLELPEAEKLGRMSFASCPELSEGKLPMIREIGAYAFTGDSRLRLEMPEYAPHVGNNDSLKDVRELCIHEEAKLYDEGLYAGYSDRISIIADDFKIPESALPEVGKTAVMSFENKPSSHEKYIAALEWDPEDESFLEDRAYTATVRLEDTGREHFTFFGFDTSGIGSDKIEDIHYNEAEDSLTVRFKSLHEDIKEEPTLPDKEPESDKETSEGGSESGSEGGLEGGDHSGDTDHDEMIKRHHRGKPSGGRHVRGALYGEWSSEGEGASARWHFSTGGRMLRDEWAYLYNPYAKDRDKSFGLFRFDEEGVMLTGIYTDSSGRRFYLNPVSDGTMGILVKGPF